MALRRTQRGALGLQQGVSKYITFGNLRGMNTQSDRHALAEELPAWLENVQPIAPNNLALVPGPAPTLTTLPGEIITRQFFAPFNGKNYEIDICASGSAYAVDLSTGNATQFNFGSVSALTANADVTVWNSQRILIADTNLGYCTWDGTAFVQQGGVSPNIQVTAGGSGYVNGATAAISGGSGSGATASVQVTGGVVTGITLTNPGKNYAAGDTLTITISPVSGGSGATATCHVWPFVTKPSTLAVYQGRVWLGNKRTIQYTGTGATYAGVGYDDFLSADASGSTTLLDPDLIQSITCLRALNNYLFIFGDNSVKQIGNVSVSGSATNFTTVTLSSDQGTSFPDSIVSYNRLVIFANSVGVFAVFGTSVEKISDDMDGVFRAIDFSQAPCAAVNDINNLHCYELLVRYIDPNLSVTRSLILCYFNKKWFTVSQGNSLRFIHTAVLPNSNGEISQSQTFGTSGNDVTQLIHLPNVAVSFTIKTALTPHSAPYAQKNVVRVACAQAATTTDTLSLLIESENNNQALTYSLGQPIVWLNALGQVVTWINALSQVVTWITGGFRYFTTKTNVSGIYLGATLTGTCSGYSLNAIIIEYQDGPMFQTKK